MKANKLLLAARHRAELHCTHGRGVPFFGWRDRVAQLAAAHSGRPARTRRAHRLLDLHLHQLAAHASLCARLGREIPGVRGGDDRRALAEFSFEHDLENVRRAARDMRVDYPIAVDNDFAIWHAFTNHYWPALYLIDAQGHLRYHHFGEGAYELSEMILRHLLVEAGIGGFRSITWFRSMRRVLKLPPIGTA